MCSKNTIKRSMDDVAVQVGFFTKNIGATSTGIIDTPKSKAPSAVAANCTTTAAAAAFAYTTTVITGPSVPS